MRRGQPCDGAGLLSEVDTPGAGAPGLRRFPRRFKYEKRVPRRPALRAGGARLPHGGGGPQKRGHLPLHHPLEFQPLCGAGRLQGQQGRAQRSGPRGGAGADEAVRRGVYRPCADLSAVGGLCSLRQAQEHRCLCEKTPEGRGTRRGLHRADQRDFLSVWHHQPGHVPHLLRPAAVGAGAGLAESVYRGAGAADGV